MFDPDHFKKAQTAAIELLAKDMPPDLRAAFLRNQVTAATTPDDTIHLGRVLGATMENTKIVVDFLNHIDQLKQEDPLHAVMAALLKGAHAYERTRAITNTFESFLTGKIPNEDTEKYITASNKAHRYNSSQIRNTCRDLREMAEYMSEALASPEAPAYLEKYSAYIQADRTFLVRNPGVLKMKIRHLAESKPPGVTRADINIDMAENAEIRAKTHLRIIKNSPAILCAMADALEYYAEPIHQVFGLAEGKNFGREDGRAA